MQVAQMLEILVRFGVRSDLITADEKETYLEYLNLAHQELYRLSASLNEDALSTEVVGTAVANGYTSLLEVPFKVIKVVEKTENIVLVPTTYSLIKNDYPTYTLDSPYEGTPTSYFMRGSKLYIAPAKETTLDVLYIPPAARLTAQTEDLPYPTSFQPILIDGALKYLYQDVEESTIKDEARIRNAAINWELGKGKLMTYLGAQDQEALRVQQEYF